MKYSFDGLNVTSFESRRSAEIEKLIAYHGGNPRVAPSMRELPNAESPNALEFAEKLFKKEIDLLILMTGVGTRILTDIITKAYKKDDYINALKNIKILARGPKPVSALRELGIKPDITVPEPNTWRDVLTTIDNEFPVDGLTVYVQEYGISNQKLLDGLNERGAGVNRISIYTWDLPEDITPLKDAIKSITKGTEDCLLFTSSQQVLNLIDVAKDIGCEDSLRDGIKTTIIGSIGPTTTETLTENGFRVDYEPDSPKMGNLVREFARNSNILLEKKRTALKNGVNTNEWSRVDMVWPEKTQQDIKQITYNSTFMKACRKEPTDYTPIWIMRQAGRFLREYRDIRSRVSFADLCMSPELAAEVTLMAVDRLGVDAAIIFSDILLILNTIGVNVEFSKGDGPRIKKPVRSKKDVDNFTEFSLEGLDFVFEALNITRRALKPDKALIGFSGAPFTVASYAIEGGGSKNYINTKKLMYKDPSLWNHFLEILTNITAEYLNEQLKNGADAIQIFDSWVGCLSVNDYEEFVLPHMKNLISKLPNDIPLILFGTGTYALLNLIKESGANVIGVDWKVNISDAWSVIGNDLAIQGNLDPVALFSSSSYVTEKARQIIDDVGSRPGHIFNLGHGVLPQTPVDNVLKLVDEVHEYSEKKRSHN